MRTPATISAEAIFVYTIAALIIFQGMLLLSPIKSINIAVEFVRRERQWRKREAELAQVFPDVWVQHIGRVEERPLVVRRTMADLL